MKIDITPLKEGIGKSLTRDEDVEISWEDEDTGIRLISPWHVHAEVVHSEAGYLLTGNAHGRYVAVCTRCLMPVQEETTLEFSECFVARSRTEGSANEECRLIEKDRIDVLPIIIEDFLLQLPMKHLCSENCAGLCAQCGANLNEETCGCEAPLDPRLSKLRQLLETKGGGQNGQS